MQSDSRVKRFKTMNDVDQPIEIHNLFEGTIKGVIKKITPTGLLICLQQSLSLDEEYRMYFYSCKVDENTCILIQGKILPPEPYHDDDIRPDICTQIYFFAVEEKERRFLNALYGGTSLADIFC